MSLVQKKSKIAMKKIVTNHLNGEQ